jgi:DNA-binding SARP family transcriptional activator
MARLCISLLGPFRVTLDEVPLHGFESNKVRALLAYLALESDRAHYRGALAGLLWPERPERIARQNLSQALSDLRRVLGDRGAVPPFLKITRQALQFNTGSDHWLDASVFLRALDPPRSLERLTQAAALYQGDFLAGFSLRGCPAFEGWMVLQQERFHCLASEALGRLVEGYEGQGDEVRALRIARRWTGLDPWQEAAHRSLMRLLALCGQRGAALAQYETCCRVAEEMGVQPEEATRALYERIRDGKAKGAKAKTPRAHH